MLSRFPRVNSCTKKSPYEFIRVSMHSGGLELTQLAYSRDVDNMLHQRGVWSPPPQKDPNKKRSLFGRRSEIPPTKITSSCSVHLFAARYCLFFIVFLGRHYVIIQLIALGGGGWTFSSWHVLTIRLYILKSNIIREAHSVGLDLGVSIYEVELHINHRW